MKLFDVKNEKYHMGHLIWDGLRSRPDAICQIDAATGESETNGSTLRRSVQFARCLLRFGVQPGDVLALSGRNHLDLHIPYYAALMIGMPIAGVDPEFKYTEIKKHFKISLPRVAFCQKERLEDNLQAIKDLNLDTKLICFGDGEYSMKRFIEEYDDGDDGDDFRPLDLDLDRIYGWLISTGGTTGMIKLAAIKHRMFFKKMVELRTVFRSFPTGDGEEDHNQNRDNMPALQLPPVQWITSFFGAVLCPPMRLIKVMTSAPTTSDHVIDIINKYKPVMAMMGPSMAAGIIKSEKECDLTCFYSLTLLGSKVHKDVYLELKKRLRPEVPLADAYGQTENLGPILTPNPSGPVGNCGNCPFDWQKNIKLMDPDTGTEIKKPFVKGEMWTKLTGFSEYYNNPEETANALTEDGWYKTGDILYRDEDGNYFFVERIKMLIKYRNYHPVMAMMGPSMAAGIIKSEKECDLTCFYSLTLLGSKVHKDVYLELKKRLRPEVPLADAYGQTENLGPILTPNPSGPVGNCGNCPFDWQKNIKLMDPDTGTEIKKPFVKGEMWTKLTGFSEYYNNPEETANALTEDGWYKTGDILYRDEDGNYFFVERIKMLIKYRNYHVVPPELEEVILEHPGVHYVSVTSIPHEEDGEHPVACVVRKAGGNVTAQEIKDLVASKLSDSQRLRGGVVFIDEIPLTSVGKIAYNKLKELALTAQRE